MTDTLMLYGIYVQYMLLMKAISFRLAFSLPRFKLQLCANKVLIR
ncbi:hypothetical protein Aazo_3825 ['Nostoc azollae' 0708]|uniref:Uncharacterized protein n=1 Tax=Nostoc azollae (strain 0708) TaxID=551115 RepID=D7E4N6_NOSA0|nr:hypothetical protein Aazo_3825 ['Nostoc azollae' 0708]